MQATTACTRECTRGESGKNLIKDLVNHLVTSRIPYGTAQVQKTAPLWPRACLGRKQRAPIANPKLLSRLAPCGTGRAETHLKARYPGGSQHEDLGRLAAFGTDSRQLRFTGNREGCHGAPPCAKGDADRKAGRTTTSGLGARHIDTRKIKRESDASQPVKTGTCAR